LYFCFFQLSFFLSFSLLPCISFIDYSNLFSSSLFSLLDSFIRLSSFLSSISSLLSFVFFIYLFFLYVHSFCCRPWLYSLVRSSMYEKL
jgi:hypothetical protein